MGGGVQPDITLILDLEAVITGVSLSNAIAGEAFGDWLGRRWSDTVAEIGGGKVGRMVSDAWLNGVSAFRQVTQRFPSGLELPIEYTTVRVDGQPGLTAVGKSLRSVSELQSRLIAAQHAMERDYWKLRDVETRYRLLFDASNESVLLLRPDDLRVIEANPAAIRALGVARGWNFLGEMEVGERDSFQAMLARARQTGRAPGIMVHLGADREPWIARATMMNTGTAPVFMLQLAPVGVRPVGVDRAGPGAVAGLFDRLPDAFVIVDRQGIVRRANAAFLDLVQAGADGAVLGASLRKWLPVAGADTAVLLSHVLAHGAVRLFQTTIRGDLGAEIEVEISGVGDTDTSPSFIGLAIRDISRRLAPSERDRAPDPAPARTGPVPLFKAVPLFKIVEEVVGQVEKDYVAAALEQTAGNRAAAAELLGMSRQSLYAKLSRYGLDGGSKKAS